VAALFLEIDASKALSPTWLVMYRLGCKTVYSHTEFLKDLLCVEWDVKPY